MKKLKGRRILNKINAKKDIKPVLDVTRAGEVKKIKIYDDGKSKVPATIFAIIVLLLGTYVIYDQFIKEKKYSEDVYTSHFEMKEDESQKFIYFTNETEIMRGLVDKKKYVTKDIVINIKTDDMQNLEKKLNDQRKEFELNYEYVDSEVMNVQNCYQNFSTYNTDTENLKSFTYREYEIYESEDFITIMVIDNNIVLCGNNNKTTITNYIIAKETGELMKEDFILNKFNADKRKLVHNSLVGLVDDKVEERTARAIKAIEDPINDNMVSYIFTEGNCIGVRFDLGENSKIVPNNYDLIEESKICKTEKGQ